MSDTIIGLSVLQPTWVEGIYQLWFKAQKADGKTNQGWIFIREGGRNDLPDKMPGWSDGTNSIWKFTRTAPGQLHCWPSVNWTSWGFHNGGSWNTEYVEMVLPRRDPNLVKWEDPEPLRHTNGAAVHYDLNLFPGLEQTHLAEELQRQGVLR